MNIREVPGSMRCYSGSVSHANDNRAAHGWIQVTEERADGWRRLVNVNQNHREEGPWWNYPAEDEARRAEEEAVASCIAAYAHEIPARTPAGLRLVTTPAKHGMLALICGSSIADEIVVGAGATRREAILQATSQARKVIRALNS